MTSRLAILAGLLGATAPSAAQPSTAPPEIVALPAASAIHVDGKLDEPAWRDAVVFDAFIQSYPRPSSPPSERTELRVLYDARYLYVGVIARDGQPGLIDHRLGRRDSTFTTDSVQVIIDSTHDHRTAYAFTLSAGGVHGDGLFYDDRNFTSDWDAVWDGESGMLADGWVAELAIPLSTLRFSDAPVQTWGFSVRRQIARRNEQIESVDNPTTSNATVSRLGHLTGLRALRSSRAVAVTPYVAARGTLRPQYADPARPHPRLFEPQLDVGLDVRAALTSSLVLNATLNPDFGQVEADQIIRNLTTYEVALPEKRAFFTQGLEFFKALGSDIQQVPQRLFYSRRIGLGTPIFGAAKLTGNLADRVTVGVLDAVVASAWQPQDEAAPDRGWQLRAERPLHFAPNTALPGSPQPTTNFLAAVARVSVGPSSRVGASVVAATPMVERCTEAATRGGTPAPGCVARGGAAAALDFDLRTASSEYGAIAQVAGSRIIGGPPSRTLPDGTVLRPGTTGYGGYVRAGRLGGEGVRWELADDFSSPTLDLNAAGFQRTQNEHAPSLTLRYERTSGVAPLKGISLRLSDQQRWTTDGRRIDRGNSLDAAVSITLPSFDSIGVEWTRDAGGYDVRELGGTGVPLQQDTVDNFALFGQTNPNRVLAISGFGSVNRFARGPLAVAWGGTLNASLSLRPHPSLETGLNVIADHTETPPRFLALAGDGSFTLGNLRSTYLSLTLRQQWLVRPRLTVQGYAQLFVDHSAYGPLFTAMSDDDRAPIRFTAMRSIAGASPRSYEVAFNPSVVVVWEYRLGSTLSLVVTHSQQGLPYADDERVPQTLAPRRLFTGPATDAVLVKWTYFYEL